LDNAGGDARPALRRSRLLAAGELELGSRFWRFLTAGQGVAGSNRPSRLLSCHENLSSRTGGR